MVEYVGELVDRKTGLVRESLMDEKQLADYLFYFSYKGNKYCIDATKETDRLGRLINHSRRNPLLFHKIIEIAGIPRLIFFAKEIIPIGVELTYDYGDRRKSVIKPHIWVNDN